VPVPLPEPPEETVALVDPGGRVVGTAPRSVVRRDNLRHAATAVLLRDGRGRIYVHRRSPDKDWAPSHHDAAAGGILRADEVPAASAARELAEELGVAGVDLVPLGLSSYEDSTTRVVEHCFEARWDGPVSFPDAEVVWGRWMTLPELGEHLRDAAWPFVPDTRALLARLRADGIRDYAALGA
jgi:8-oxo-dGTP pyrophosphatase MutT (NUDIX family)